MNAILLLLAAVSFVVRFGATFIGLYQLAF